MAPLLEVKNMGIRFGGLVALEDVNVKVDEWEIVGLIGPNGAGKTTLFNCVTGAYTPNSGQTFYRGRDISYLPTHRRTTLGIGRTFQQIGLVRGLTVLENLLVAQHSRIGYGPLSALIGSPRTFAEERKLRTYAMEVLDFIELAHLADSHLDGLPYGTLKLIEVGSVLATDPEVLLLDEPSSGMGPDEAHEFGVRLLELRKALNLTVLMIEHHVPLVVDVCDYVYCLNFGRILTDGKPDAVKTHPEVVAAYIGGEAEDAATGAAGNDGEGWKEEGAGVPA